MLINRAYMFRLYPADEQKIFINKCIGCSRFIYKSLCSEIYYIENKIKLNFIDIKKVKRTTIYKI